MSRSRFHVASARLRLRDVSAADLERIYEVFRSNPEFLMLRDDLLDRGADYDSSLVTRYCESAMLDPARHLLAVVHETSDSVVGLVDFVEESPADGHPWVGLVVIDRPVQRQGLGSEALNAVLAVLGSAGYPAARMAVMETNPSCLAFAESIGFTAYDTATVATSQGSQRVGLMELPLGPAEPAVGHQPSGL